jgi:DNA-binding NarL/FixJ family response regulator
MLMEKTNTLCALTSREMQILGLLAKGYRNRQIACILSIKERTVRFHVSNILTKLRVDTRTGLVAIALQNRYIAS